MAAARTERGNNQVSGTYFDVWWDEELLFETSKLEAKVILEREEVQLDIDVDTKYTKAKGEGILVIKMFYTRGMDKYLEAYKAGKDPRGTIISKVKDPDTPGGQEERVKIGNVWLNELILAMYERGTPAEREIPFGFTPKDASFFSTIEKLS